MLDPRLHAFLDYFNQISGQHDIAPTALYHKDVSFIDPVHQIQGAAALQRYLNHGYQRLNYARFEPITGACSGDVGFLSWVMSYSHPAIGKGKEISVQGCSELRWRGEQIIYHRDYYDMTEMVYQQIPVLGWLTGQVKRKMAAG